MARRTQSSDTSFKLDDYDLGQFSLMRPTRLGAKRLAIDLVKIDPWRTLQIDQLKLAGFGRSSDSRTDRQYRVAWSNQRICRALVMRRGPQAWARRRVEVE